MKCVDCGGDYKTVDEETTFSGKKFELLECEKCSRSIIVPAQESASNSKDG